MAVEVSGLKALNRTVCAGIIAVSGIAEVGSAADAIMHSTDRKRVNTDAAIMMASAGPLLGGVMLIPQKPRQISSHWSEQVPQRDAINTSSRAKTYMKSHIPQTNGRDFRYTPQVLLMWTPNILNPRKLAANIRHPVREVLHTNHTQYPVAMKEGIEYHIVEHRLFNKLVTVDVIHEDTFAKGVIPRVKQLFDSKFYYGHASFFPQPFRLVDRTFVQYGFNQDEHINKTLE